MPVSITATSAPVPCERAQAPGKPLRIRFHWKKSPRGAAGSRRDPGGVVRDQRREARAARVLGRDAHDAGRVEQLARATRRGSSRPGSRPRPLRAPESQRSARSPAASSAPARRSREPSGRGAGSTSTIARPVACARSAGGRRSAAAAAAGGRHEASAASATAAAARPWRAGIASFNNAPGPGVRPAARTCVPWSGERQRQPAAAADAVSLPPRADPGAAQDHVLGTALPARRLRARGGAT